VLEPFGVPLEAFVRQIDLLRRQGYVFVTPDEVSAFARGQARLPRRAVLVTFDDGYEDLEAAAAELASRHIRAIVFAVSGRLGGENAWDHDKADVRLRLLDATGLRRLEGLGVEIGAHSRTHPELPALDAASAAEEIGGAIEDLAAHGLRRPRFFAYPYGGNGRREQKLVQEAGCAAAFSTLIGVAGGPQRFAWPRIEVHRAHEGARFLRRVRYAGLLALVARFEIERDRVWGRLGRVRRAVFRPKRTYAHST
jgi:peptidoglycan/xylan/chitin deacetylase (PgdA/CDA1 family)